MQTQCPHCKSRYRLSPEMIEAYGGFVRCGNCDYKFNVHDQVRLDNDYFELSDENAVQDDYIEDRPGFRRESGNAAAADRVEPRLDAPEEDELNIRFRADEYEFEEDMPDRPAEKIEPRFEFPSLNDSPVTNSKSDSFQDAIFEQPEDGELEEDQVEVEQVEEEQVEVDQIEVDQVEVEQVEVEQVEVEQVEEEQVEEEQVEVEQVEVEQAESAENQATGDFSNPFEEAFSDSESSKDSTDKRNLSAQSIDQAMQDQTDAHADDFHFGEKFEVEDDDQRIEPSFSSQSLINDDAEEDDSGSNVFQVFIAVISRFFSFAFWLVAAIALAYLLLGQIKDRVYPAYKQTPLVQSIRDSVCSFIPCMDDEYDIEQYEIVVSRMDEINKEGRQLHISVFLLNKAQHAQAYPNLQITLKRIDGSTTGRRVITPEEYTTSHNSLISSTEANGSSVTKILIKPNKLGKVLIKFDKPPADAVGFEARVVD